MLYVSVQRTTVTSAMLLGYSAISEGKRFHKTRRGYMRSSDRKRYPSSIQTYVAIRCCASSNGQPFPERTSFAARASSTSMFERRKLFLNSEVRK